jgi:hypothetical protein
VGRIHIAKALVAGGYVGDIDEAFQKYLIKGRPAFAPRLRLLPEEAIDMIINVGGIPVLAHPKFGVPTKKIAQYLVKKGLKGIEVYYPAHSPEEQDRYFSWAEEMGLLVTGGSDCHGELPGRPEAIGRQYVPYLSVVKLKEFKYMMMRRNTRLFEEV